MALSDDERRVLEEMERQLTGANVVTVRAPRRANIKLAIIGVVVLVAGIGVLLSGVVTQTPALGVVGFGVMVLGMFLILNRRGEQSDAPPRGNSTPPSPRSSRMEDRWQRRMDGEL